MLTVHKNTRDQRRSKETRKHLISEAKELATLKDISGYVIVVWDEDNSFNATWNTSYSNFPALLLPEYAKQILTRKMESGNVNNIIDSRLY